MKKVVFVLGCMLLGSQCWAVDQVARRQAIARKSMVACQQIVDALNVLKELKDERGVLGNFVDSDFSTTTDMIHLDAATVGTLFDFVVGSLDTTYQDVPNSGRNKQILLSVRK